MDNGEFEAAHGYLDEAFPLLEAADDQIHLTWGTVELANLAFEEGDAELAIRHLKGALAMGDALAAELSDITHSTADRGRRAGPAVEIPHLPRTIR